MESKWSSRFIMFVCLWVFHFWFPTELTERPWQTGSGIYTSKSSVCSVLLCKKDVLNTTQSRGQKDLCNCKARWQKHTSHVVFCPFLGDIRKVPWQQNVPHLFDLLVKYVEEKFAAWRVWLTGTNQILQQGGQRSPPGTSSRFPELKKTACMCSKLATVSQDWLHLVKRLTQVKLPPANSPKQLDLEEEKTNPTDEPFPWTCECAVMACNMCTV